MLYCVKRKNKNIPIYSVSLRAKYAKIYRFIDIYNIYDEL